MQPQNSSHKSHSTIDPVDTLILSIQSEQPLNPSWSSETLLQTFENAITEPPIPQFPSRSHVSPHTPPSRLPPRHTITRTRSPTRNQPIFSKSLQHHPTPPRTLPPNTTSEASSVEQLHQTFALPQTIAGSYLTKHESLPTTPLQYAVTTVEQELLSPTYSPQHACPPQEPACVDYEKYVRQSAITAETVKVRYRDQLKKEQLARENAAKERGSPMTAKEKERERSRRESAVTRKRAEVYIKELEKVTRRLPFLEMKLRILELELHRLTNSPHFHPHTSQQQIHHPPPPPSVPQHVKTEPQLLFSPASQRTSTVINQMQHLDLRLQNASQTG